MNRIFISLMITLLLVGFSGCGQKKSTMHPPCGGYSGTSFRAGGRHSTNCSQDGHGTRGIYRTGDAWSGSCCPFYTYSGYPNQGFV